MTWFMMCLEMLQVVGTSTNSFPMLYANFRNIFLIDVASPPSSLSIGLKHGCPWKVSVIWRRRTGVGFATELENNGDNDIIRI